MKTNNKTKKILQIVAYILLCSFIVICAFVTSECFTDKANEIISIIGYICLVLSIPLFIISNRINKKISIDNNKTIIDNNTLKGRKLYKNTFQKSFKVFSLICIISISILILPVIVFYIINFNLLLIIIFSIMIIILPLLILAITYILFKHFYFPYKEITYNGETFVLFASSDNLGSNYYQPYFHVIYNENEYIETKQSTYVGPDIVLSVLDSLSNSYNKNSYCLQININSKTLGNIQCTYILATRKFLVSSTQNENDSKSNSSTITPKE